jgi:hemolysin activation/secretion protein
MLAAAADCMAQVAPDPSALPDPNLDRENTLRIEPLLNDGQSQAPAPEVVIEGPAAGDDGNLPESDSVFQLSDIHFSDSFFIDATVLHNISADYIGHPVHFADINAMIGKINAIYAQRGIVSARALVPPQTIDSGVLEVRLVEGRLGELEIDGNKAVKSDFISERINVAAGQVVDVPNLRDELTRLNRTTELSVQSALRAGQAPGSTDLILHVTEPARYSAQTFTDNQGTESTGQNRFGGIAQIYAPFGIDDRLTFYGVGSDGAKNFYVGYGLPVSRSGARVDVSYSKGDIEIVEGPYVALGISGASSGYNLGYTYPIRRTNTFWLDAYGTLASSSSKTRIGTAPLSEFDVSNYTVGLKAQGFSEKSVWSVRQGVGTEKVDNIFDENTALTLYAGDASYFYRLRDKWSLRAQGGWQFTSEETAPSPVLFQVGGIGSVRGYDNGAVAGARGYAFSLESRYQWRENLQPYAFVDHGYVDDISPDKESISSMGFGLTWKYGRYLSGDLSYAKTLKDVLPDQDSGRLLLRIDASFSKF